MMKTEFQIIINLIYILMYIHTSHSQLSKKKLKRKNRLFLPSVIEFEVKGNSMGWVPITFDEYNVDMNNCVQISSSNDLSFSKRNRRNLYDNANFISGVLSCPDGNSTIEPDVIYDDADDYHSEETTTSTTERSEQENETTTKSIFTTDEIIEKIGDTKSTIATIRSTMPTKSRADNECTVVTKSHTTTSAQLCRTTIAESTKCIELKDIVSKNFCLPQIITPPQPLPPLNLDFISCGKYSTPKVNLTSITSTSKTVIPTKAFEKNINVECSQPHFLFGAGGTSTFNESTTRRIKGNKSEITTLLTTDMINNTTEISQDIHDETSIKPSSSSMSKLQKFLSPFRNRKNKTDTTTQRIKITSNIHNTEKTEFVTSKHHTEFVNIVTKTTKHHNNSGPTTEKHSTASTNSGTAEKKLYTDLPAIGKTSSKHNTQSQSTSTKIPTVSITKSITEKQQPLLLFGNHMVNEQDGMMEFPSLAHIGKDHHENTLLEDNPTDNEDPFNLNLIDKLYKKNQLNGINEKNFIFEKPISKVIIRIPSRLGDLPVVILRDPQIPTVSLSVVPVENKDNNCLPFINYLPLPNAQQVSFSNQDVTTGDHNMKENNIGNENPLLSQVNPKFKFNLYNMIPYNNLNPYFNKYSLISKYSFMEPERNSPMNYKQKEYLRKPRTLKKKRNKCTIIKLK